MLDKKIWISNRSEVLKCILLFKTWASVREYLMDNRGPDFLAILRFGSSPTYTPPIPTSASCLS
jgi:hypothetical protein